MNPPIGLYSVPIADRLLQMTGSSRAELRKSVAIANATCRIPAACAVEIVKGAVAVRFWIVAFVASLSPAAK